MMKTADQVTAIIAQVKQDMINDRISASAGAWTVAMACVGWAYVYGAYGEYCDPANRRSRYNGTKAGEDKDNIKNKCKNFNGRDDVPSGCVGCQWFLGTALSNPATHEGRTRFFDCRGFVYFVLDKLFGFFGGKCPAGCTTMWNTDLYWKERGLVKDGVPDGVLVCLFRQDSKRPNVMAHIGFGYNGETVECSVGVEYHEKRAVKWTHWAIPACVDDEIPDYRPTIRRGSTGPAVVECQDDLIQLGYDVGKTGADGIFGANTEKAVKAFQTDHGLTSDGVVGPATWAALDAAIIEPEPKPDTLYTVTIPHLTGEQADSLIDAYPGATMREERGD